MISENLLQDFERVVAGISGELPLIEPGKDEGLVPVYSLLSDLEPLLKGDDRAFQRCRELQSRLGEVLDVGGNFDEKLIQRTLEFVDKLQTLLRFYRMGELIEWDAIEQNWQKEDLEFSAGPAEQESSAEVPADAELPSLSSSDQLMVLDLEDSRDVLEEFYQEAVEHLDNIEAATLELEEDPTSTDAISSVFRSFHTIKGVAGFLDLTPVRTLAHEVETLLDLVRSSKLKLHAGLISLVLESRDRLQGFIDQVQAGLEQGVQPAEIIPIGDLISRTQIAMGVEEIVQPPKADEDPLIEVEIPSLEPESDAEEAVTEEAEEISEEMEAAKAAKKTQPKAGGKAAATIRMNTEKLDGIIDAVGELVIVESQLRDSVLSEGNINSRIERNLAQLGRITGELQRTGLSLRMVSLKQLFQKMQRLARDLGTKSGKKIVFEVEGEDTEMDRTVVEKMGDPLVHMIRNSLDHGVEGPEERSKVGKSPMGKVTLKAYYKGDSIVLELQDDGRGVNTEKVLKKAIERGLAQEGRKYTKDEIINFLFMAGFSTAEKVSDISGRGVGMDVVRSNVQKLRGRIDMQSEQGVGSVVKISLPLTMAIIDGLLIRVGNERYILPVTSVNMTLKPRPDQLFTVQSRGKVIKHREEIFQLLHLGDFFGVTSDFRDAKDAVIVMIEADGDEFGLIVDEILHKQEVVVKNLGGTMTHPVGVSGGAILGDGTIALILDPPGLAKSEAIRRK